MLDIFKKPVSSNEMSDDEMALQLEKIDHLKYQNFLLEFIAHKAAPGKMEFPEFQKHLKEAYNASSKQGSTEIHGDLRTQPETRAGKMS
jgi:hypothetical protein